jgi:hypothetical protein
LGKVNLHDDFGALGVPSWTFYSLVAMALLLCLSYSYESFYYFSYSSYTSSCSNFIYSTTNNYSCMRLFTIAPE